jgi:steroid delta-isomerase-like uncharacterized protein
MEGYPVVTEQNQASMDGIYEIFNGGDASRVHEFLADDLVEHEEVPGVDIQGADGFLRLVAIMRSGFPDFRMEIVQTVSQNDKTAVHFRATGTHRGEFLGIPPTGRRAEIEGVDILRFANGKAVEHWGFWDSGKLMQQPGVAP